MQREKIVILGTSVISPLGGDLARSYERARAGESGIGELTRFPIPDKFPVTISGEIEPIDFSPYSFLGGRELVHWTSPIFPYGLLSVHQALEAAGFTITDEIAPRTAITYSTAIGGLDAVLHADRKMIAEGKLPQPFVNPNACINMITGKISMFTGAKGPIATVIDACATGNASMATAAMFIQMGMADVAIAGAVDFPLVEPIVAGFATMNGAYKHKPAKDEPPRQASKPFDKMRRGFVVSEGASAIILSSEAFAKAHGLKYDIALAGIGMTADAHHFVAPNLPTIKEAMAKAIAMAGIVPEDIDLINAHAASTKAGDETEAIAICEIFGDEPPPVTANKSMIGHAMGASSAIESVFAIEGMRRAEILPTINYETPDEKIPMTSLQTSLTKAEQEFVLKNAFGFGGCNCCLVFRRV